MVLSLGTVGVAADAGEPTGPDHESVALRGTPELGPDIPVADGRVRIVVPVTALTSPRRPVPAPLRPGDHPSSGVRVRPGLFRRTGPRGVWTLRGSGNPLNANPSVRDTLKRRHPDAPLGSTLAVVWGSWSVGPY